MLPSNEYKSLLREIERLIGLCQRIDPQYAALRDGKPGAKEDWKELGELLKLQKKVGTWHARALREEKAKASGR